MKIFPAKENATSMPGKRRQPTRRYTAVQRLLAIATMEGPRAGRTMRAAEIAAQHGCSLSTVWEWHRKARYQGLAAFMQARSDKGRSRFLAKHPDMELMICDRIAPGRSAMSIFKSLRTVLGSKAPSYYVTRLLVQGRYLTEHKLRRAA